jgi:hypothetical protein
MQTILKNNQERAKIAIIVLGAIILVQIIGIIFYFFQYNLLEKAENFGISDEEADSNDNRVAIINYIYIFLLIVSAVTFILWFRRAYYNLGLKISYLKFTDGWAAGSWFVPIVSLYRPFQIMRELFEETAILFKKARFKSDLNTNLVIGWWTLWLIGNFSAQFTNYLPSETIEDLKTQTIALILSNFVEIASALMAILVIKNYNDHEEHLVTLNEVKDEDYSPFESIKDDFNRID